MNRKVVVGVTGMPGAGKATVVRIVRKMGYPVVVMGDKIREETRRRGLKPNPENIGIVMLKLREEEGLAVVAKRCIPEIKQMRKNLIIIDGIRSLHEVKEFKKHFTDFPLLAIYASSKTRFQRLFRRKRTDDPMEWKTFMQRDLRELSVGLGEAIATADHMIINEGTKKELDRKLREVFEGIIKSE